MTVSAGQLRVQRAQELAEKHPFSAEILGFYIHVARFQDEMRHGLNKTLPHVLPDLKRELSANETLQLASTFESFLCLAEAHGPKKTAELARDMRLLGEASRAELLSSSWAPPSSSDAGNILASAFLQPYAEFLRSRAKPEKSLHTHAVCVFCNRKPSFGVMRQMGDGAARSLVCSFCLGEWEFRRLV